MPAERSGTRMNSWYGRPIEARSASMSLNSQASIWLLSGVRCGVGAIVVKTGLGEQLRGGTIAGARSVDGQDELSRDLTDVLASCRRPERAGDPHRQAIAGTQCRRWFGQRGGRAPVD